MVDCKRLILFLILMLSLTHCNNPYLFFVANYSDCSNPTKIRRCLDYILILFLIQIFELIDTKEKQFEKTFLIVLFEQCKENLKIE